MKLFQKKRKIGENISYLKPDTPIEITEFNKNNIPYIYLSKLEKHISQSELLVAIPLKNNKLIKLEIGKDFLITFKTKECLFQNKIKIIKYELIENIPFLKIRLLQETIKIQKRANYRLKKTIEFNFDLVEEASNAMLKCESALLSTGLTCNISSGGVKFLSNENLQELDIIKMLIPFNDSSITAIAKVLIKNYADDKKSTYTYCYSCQFVNINTNDKEYITACIFKEQRELSRKGEFSEKDDK